MTRFQSAPRQQNNIFFEVMTARDKNTFMMAFSKSQNGGNTERLGEARRWVSDVIDLWAEKVDLPRALAFMVITTGGYDVVRRHFARRQQKLNASLTNSMATSHREAIGKEIAACTGVMEMDNQNMRDWLREPWVMALTLQHPSTRTHVFTGFTKAKPGEQKKIGEDAKPKPRVPAKRAKHIVVKKGEREKFVPQSEAH